MKSNIVKITAALLVTVIIAGVSIWQVKFNKDWREEYAYAKGIEALVYAFPYFLDSALLYKWSLPQVPENNKGPANAINQFWQSSELSNPKNYRDGGMPNRDTFYSLAWMYTDGQPLIISVPEHANERYYTFELAGFDSDNFAYVGKRTHGNVAGNYAVTRPAREMLFTRVDRETRFKAKPVIDIVAYRGGDTVMAWLFTGLTQGLGVGLAGVAIVGAIIAALWAMVGIYLGRWFERDEKPQG